MRSGKEVVVRLVRVGIGELTVEELEEMVAHVATVEPEHAAQLRRVLEWRVEHPLVPPPETNHRVYFVLR